MAIDHLPPDITPVEHHTPRGWERWSELLVAGGMIVIGIIVLIYTQDIRVTRGTTVDPRLIPEIVGVGALLAGAWYFIDIIRTPHDISGGEDSEDVDINAPTDWTALLIIGIALTVFAFLVETAGFSIASAVMFSITSFGMGSRKYIHNSLIGLGLGIAVFLVFDTWLGVRLPTGWLEGILP